MSPRPYQLKRRRAGMDATRSKIIEAARSVLVSGDGFSIEAVAREAGVARLTVYDRFGSREALVEAIFNELAESGGLTGLPLAFGDPDPVAALEHFVLIFCGFYSAHRTVLRRLNALTVLGRTTPVGIDRNARRLQGLEVLLARVAAAGHEGADAPDVIHAVHILTGFAFIDDLAGVDRDPVDIAPSVVEIVKRVAHLG